jgi:hypothetical protein
MRDQGVAWLRLDCLKPSFLAPTRRDVRKLNDTHMEDVYRWFLPMTSVLSNILSAHRRMRERNEREPKPLDLYKTRTKRGWPKLGCPPVAMSVDSENPIWLRSFHSSPRQITTAAWRRKAGHSIDGMQRYAKCRALK